MTPATRAMLRRDVSAGRGLQRRIDWAVANPLVSYLAIFVLQLRVVWNSWRFRDLTSGDTAGYFVYAAGWANHLQDDAVWSPLYTNFWGTILAALNNVYAAAMVHRVVIVFAATLLVLALMRKLLHPALALIIAAWWAVLPANFNVLYEVHLFGVLPILLVFLLLALSPGRTALGLALALLAATTLLLRNELIVATLLLAGAIVISEGRKRRHGPRGRWTYWRAYGVPVALVLLLAGGSYWRSAVQGHRFESDFHTKQGLNICQVYAFNFQQRHPSRFRGNAFTECRPLMQQTFHKQTPTLLEAAAANPRAVAGMINWNLRLWPSGMQVALFNATSTGDQPDYIPVDTHRSYALILSLLLIGLFALGGWAIRREATFWRDWAAPRAWLLLGFGAVAITTAIVVLTERPRPEYMYGLTVAVMALAGVCFTAVLRRRNAMRFAGIGAAALTLGLIVAVPDYYHKGPRPVHDAIERLKPVTSQLQKPGSVLIASRFNSEICLYLAASFDRDCTSPEWLVLEAKLAAGAPIGAILDQYRATVIYADPVLLGDPAIAKLAAAPLRYGWRQLAGGIGDGGPWRVLVRAS
jgi:hypothetical protein